MCVQNMTGATTSLLPLCGDDLGAGLRNETREENLKGSDAECIQYEFERGASRVRHFLSVRSRVFDLLSNPSMTHAPLRSSPRNVTTEGSLTSDRNMYMRSPFRRVSFIKSTSDVSPRDKNILRNVKFLVLVTNEVRPTWSWALDVQCVFGTYRKRPRKSLFNLASTSWRKWPGRVTGWEEMCSGDQTRNA